MALVDSQNKVIYWDEVNWMWLPHIKVENGRSCYLVKVKKRIPVNSREEMIKALISLNYRLLPLKVLGVTELYRGCFMYGGKLYKLNIKKPAITSLLIEITGKSPTWVSKRFKGEGVISKSFIDKLVSETSGVHFRGKIYKNYSQLAKDLGISKSYLSRHLSKGRSLEKVVEEYEKNSFVTDHLGNKFKDYSKLAEAYGSEYNLLSQRLKRGWSLERALTAKLCTPKENSRNSKECVDHLGNSFTSQTNMAKYHGVALKTLGMRLKRGWTLEEALTGKRSK